MTSKLQEFLQGIEQLPDSYHQLDMGALMPLALAALPEILEEQPKKSLFINYEQPFLMRISYKFGEQKKIYLSFHEFFAVNYTDMQVPGTDLVNPYYQRAAQTEKSQNLYHPHPWAASFKILKGAYDQKIGLATERGLDQPPMVTNIIRQDAENPLTDHYAFNDPLIWHEVVPVGTESVSTVMLTYKPNDWNQTGPTPPETKSLRALNAYEEKWMQQRFKSLLQPR